MNFDLKLHDSALGPAINVEELLLLAWHARNALTVRNR